MEEGTPHFTRVEFTRFKAYTRFSLAIKHFNILVGPNNAGKSTIIAAFRILSIAMKKAQSRKAEVVDGPNGPTRGYLVDISSIAVSEENIFFNYDDSEPASVKFTYSNRSSLLLYFGAGGKCVMIASGNKPCQTPTTFKREFPGRVAFTPVLGPVEHSEKLFEKGAAQRALYNYSASRNFRNIWHHFPDKFDDFRNALRRTWPGMDIQPPKVDYENGSPTLYMMCPEERIPREICWAGFGFQVWCQMLTHLIQSSDAAIFLIDEPDIYLHSDLQRQLVSILRDLGPDILMATHSTEIITEAEPDEIVLIDKKRQSAKRIQGPSQLGGVFGVLGSSLNPVLTQLAKTKRAVFVEGKDFQTISRFASKLGMQSVSIRANFAVIPIEGFNPQKIKNFVEGIQLTLGGPISSLGILDRDFRSDEERTAIEANCKQFGIDVCIHRRKEIENFLLVPEALERAARMKVTDRNKRTGKATKFTLSIKDLLRDYAAAQRNYVTGQYQANRTEFEKRSGGNTHFAKLNEQVLEEIDENWETLEKQLMIVPGKDALSHLNEKLQVAALVSLSPTVVISSMQPSEVPSEMVDLLHRIEDFSK